MRSFLFLEGDVSSRVDLDVISGRTSELDPSVAHLTFSSPSGHKWQAQLRAADAGGPEKKRGSSASCGVDIFLVEDDETDVTTSPGGISLTWDERLASWKLDRLPNGRVEVLLNGSTLRSQRPLTQGSCWIEVRESNTENSGTKFLFKRTPAPPVVEGKPRSAVILPKGGLRIGRISSKIPDGAMLSLGLDPEIRSISSNQAEIIWDGRTRNWVLVNKHSPPLLLNGTSDYEHDRCTLVFGDCLQIPGYGFYTFQFNGSALVHLGDGGAIQARGLEKVVRGGRRILSNINLDLRCGEFVGVLGGSGQGKSTMMNSVCSISPATSGQVWLDGRQLRSASDIADEAIGYVPQDDIVHRELTVREALEFAGKLRLAINDRQLARAIDRVLESLELQTHQNKKIRVLSGGQRKRVSIASELLTNPRFLFLDEPTSGLDPQTEWELMGLLHRLRLSRPMGIFCTTHVLQKSHVFDSVVFVHGGRIIFKGTPVDAARYFMVDQPFDDGEPSESVSESLVDLPAGQDTGPDISDDRLLSALPLVYRSIEGAFQKLGRHNEMGGVKDPEDIVKEMERVYLESSYREPLDPLTNEVRRESPAQSGKIKKGGRASRPGGLCTLGTLMARQWKILTSEPLNVVFLLTQALVIGALVGWVSENLVFQMFIAVIATLWFGCSNAAQQIVGELPIFRRERLAGVGLNVYLAGKLGFLTLITSVQALILISAVLISHHCFHAEELPLYPEATRSQNKKAFTEIFFSNRSEFMIPGVAAPPIPNLKGQSDDTFDPIAGFEVVFQDGLAPVPGAPVAHYENPSGLRSYDAEFHALEWMAWFFRIRENLIGELGVNRVEISADRPYSPPPKRHWWTFTAMLLAIRLGSLLAAAITGVALGLAVSALVQTPTQAVMWVPLILIPQILFGGFVVTSPEMEAPVRRFSEALPSFNLQRLQDVTNVYGRKAPRITNKTKIPAFFSAPPYDEETTRWQDRKGSNQEKYDKISEVSKSWQNLIVLPSVIGHRFKEGQLDSVKIRRDVIFPEGVNFRFSGGALRSLVILLIWVGSLYLITLGGLRSKQAQ